MGILTTAGIAKLAQAQQSGQHFVIDQIIFANYPGLDPNGTPPISTQKPTIDKIVHTASITAGYINNDTVVYKAQLLPNVGDFSFNWVGLFSSSTNTLVAVNYQTLQHKTKTNEVATGNIIVKSFSIQYAQLKNLVGVTIQAGLDYVDVVDLINAKADKTHGHKIADVENLQSTLEGKSPTHSHPYAPTTHTHTIGNITNLDSTLSGINASLTNKAPISHNHAIDAITNLVNVLAGKSDTGHSHTSAGISDLSLLLSDYAKKDLSNSTNNNLIKAIVVNTDIQKNVDGYILFKNGFKIQFGRYMSTASSGIINFTYPFNNMNYIFIAMLEYYTTDTGGLGSSVGSAIGGNQEYKTTTSIRVSKPSNPATYWFALGF